MSAEISIKSKTLRRLEVGEAALKIAIDRRAAELSGELVVVLFLLGDTMVF